MKIIVKLVKSIDYECYRIFLYCFLYFLFFKFIKIIIHNLEEIMLPTQQDQWLVATMLQCNPSSLEASNIVLTQWPWGRWKWAIVTRNSFLIELHSNKFVDHVCSSSILYFDSFSIKFCKWSLAHGTVHLLWPTPTWIQLMGISLSCRNHDTISAIICGFECLLRLSTATAKST